MVSRVTLATWSQWSSRAAASLQWTSEVLRKILIERREVDDWCKCSHKEKTVLAAVFLLQVATARDVPARVGSRCCKWGEHDRHPFQGRLTSRRWFDQMVKGWAVWWDFLAPKWTLTLSALLLGLSVPWHFHQNVGTVISVYNSGVSQDPVSAFKAWVASCTRCTHIAAIQYSD